MDFIRGSLVAAVFLLSVPERTLAEDKILYCSETHIVGMQLHEGQWLPTYDDGKDGRRYAIRFDEKFSEMSGFQGTDTRYRCGNFFPTKARDVVTCTNPLVATMVFSYSKETGNFLMSLTHPGGWLALGTEREDDMHSADHLIFGKCQEF